LRKILYLALIAFFVACGSDKQKRFVGDDANYSEKDIVNGGTLVAGINGEPDALNPLTGLLQPAINIQSLIFRRLADINEDLATFSPQMAKSWEFSKNGLAITFHLRTDVFWHDGAPFSAKDVVFTHEIEVNPKIFWDGASFKVNIKKVIALNDSTVVFYFAKKSPTMLMDAVEGFILPEHLLKNVSPEKMPTIAFNRHPVGTGPFRFQEWRSQQYVILTQFDRYYETGKPHLDTVIFKIIPDGAGMVRQLLSGDIDFTEVIPPRDFIRLQKEWKAGNSPLRPVSYLGRTYDFIGWNLIDGAHFRKMRKRYGEDVSSIQKYIQPHPLFGSRKVRTALTMAIDRVAVARIVNDGMATPMNGPISLVLWGYNEKANRVVPFDPKRAAKLLKEEGWKDSDGDGVLEKDGRKFRFEMITNAGNTRREQALTLIQNQLKQVGVEMIPRIADSGLLFGRMLPERDFDAVLIGWNVALKMDLSPLFHRSSFFIPFHFNGYYSPEFDRLEELAESTISPQEAQKYWDGITTLLSTDLPYTWLYYKMECSAIHRRFKNVVIDQRGAYNNLEDWWIPVKERRAIGD